MYGTSLAAASPSAMVLPRPLMVLARGIVSVRLRDLDAFGKALLASFSMISRGVGKPPKLLYFASGLRETVGRSEYVRGNSPVVPVRGKRPKGECQYPHPVEAKTNGLTGTLDATSCCRARHITPFTRAGHSPMLVIMVKSVRAVLESNRLRPRERLCSSDLHA
jgi:hypothetical protein